VKSDLVIGADGAFSAVRQKLSQRFGFNFSQTYIEHGYLELCIPPGPNGEVKKNADKL
jgi:kynurenine 3-monooxygenase